MQLIYLVLKENLRKIIVLQQDKNYNNKTINYSSYEKSLFINGQPVPFDYMSHLVILKHVEKRMPKEGWIGQGPVSRQKTGTIPVILTKKI